MLSTQDILNLSLAIGFLVLTGFISYAAYHAAITLKAVRRAVNHVENTTAEIERITDGVKIGTLSLIKNILKGRGGEHYGTS